MYMKKSINKILYIQNYLDYFNYIHKHSLSNCNAIDEENLFKLKRSNSFRP